MSPSEVLRRISSALDRAGIAYMLTGSFASTHYGSPRSTQDIDIVVVATPAQLRTFVQSLPNLEYYSDIDAALEAHKRQSLFNVIDLATGWKIDLIIRKSRAFSLEEFDRRQLVTVQGLPLFVASAEDVVIAKLEWSKLAESQRQLEDVATILTLRWEALDRSYLGKWISALDLRQEWSHAKRIAGISDNT
jgi:predicted nucleotidyltransferase